MALRSEAMESSGQLLTVFSVVAVVKCSIVAGHRPMECANERKRKGASGQPANSQLIIPVTGNENPKLQVLSG